MIRFRSSSIYEGRTLHNVIVSAIDDDDNDDSDDDDGNDDVHDYDVDDDEDDDDDMSVDGNVKNGAC